MHPDDRETARAAWSQTLATGQPFDREERLLGADGVYRWLHIRGYPLGAPEGLALQEQGGLSHEQLGVLVEGPVVGVRVED